MNDGALDAKRKRPRPIKEPVRKMDAPAMDIAIVEATMNSGQTMRASESAVENLE